MKTGLFSYKFQSSSSQGLFVDIKTLYMYLFGIPCSYGIQPKVIYLVGVLAFMTGICVSSSSYLWVIIPNNRGCNVVN